MKAKNSVILFYLLLVTLLAVGAAAPSYVLADGLQVSELGPVGGFIGVESVNDQTECGTAEVSGDPDSAGDGLEDLDPSILGCLLGFMDDQDPGMLQWLFLMIEQGFLAP